MEFAVNKRLIEIYELKKFSWEELRVNLGINKPQQISGWVQCKDKIPARHIIKIIELFPDLNARWFITGEGSMTETSDQGNQVNEGREKYNNNGCKLCEEKDARIKLLEEILEMYRGKKGNDVANSA